MLGAAREAGVWSFVPLILHYVAFVDDWPMSTMKIEKFALRGQLANAMAVQPQRLG